MQEVRGSRPLVQIIALAIFTQRAGRTITATKLEDCQGLSVCPILFLTMAVCRAQGSVHPVRDTKLLTTH